MKIINLKGIIGIVLMILFSAMSWIINDAIKSNLFASVSIIAGAFASHNLSTQNKINNE